MTISNGYITSAEFLAYAIPQTTSGNLTSAQVTVIENIIEGASRFIDDKTRKTFYARAETKKYEDIHEMVRAERYNHAEQAAYFDEGWMVIHGEGEVLKES